MSLHAPKGKESGTTKIPCLKSHIQIHLPADRSWCAGQIQLWFVRCPFGLSNLTGKHGLQEGDQLANFIVANYRNSFVYEQIGISSLNPSSSSVASHDCLPEPSTGSCGCSDRRSAQIAHSKRFLSRCMCRSLEGCPKSCGREELVESHWEPIEFKVPRVVVENTELPCPQHSSVLLGDMPRERVVQNDGHNQCNDDRR